SIAIITASAPAPPSSLRRWSDEDLDAIIGKLLQKDPDKRYDSASELGTDLQRYLRHEPILARPAGPLGRMARWVRRNRAAAAVAGVSTLVLTVTSVSLVARILHETHRANANLVEAQRNLLAANETLSLMKGLFSSLKPDELTQGNVNV